MRTALITTTVNVPEVLRLYRRHGADVQFFVAGDEKTPPETADLCVDLGATYLAPDQQTRWKCSSLLGWNNIQRRNIALLEALQWGADIIISCDDDNIPIDEDYFAHFSALLNCDAFAAFRRQPFSGLSITGFNGWFDVGRLLNPESPHRGFPHTHRSLWYAKPITDAKVGVAAGICLGDPDISAVDRTANHPVVHNVSELLRSGIVVDNKIWTVFNSQNTAFTREIAPAMMMWPGVGRHDDIFASLVAQRVMRELDLHVHFGQPFVWQQRNQHDLVKDLKAELFGMTHLADFAAWLESPVLDQKIKRAATPVGKVRAIFDDLDACSEIPSTVVETGAAWCCDVEEAMK